MTLNAPKHVDLYNRPLIVRTLAYLEENKRKSHLGNPGFRDRIADKIKNAKRDNAGTETAIRTADNRGQVVEQIAEKDRPWININQNPSFDPQRAVNGFYNRLSNFLQDILIEKSNNNPCERPFRTDIESKTVSGLMNKSDLQAEILKTLQSLSQEFRERIYHVQITDNGLAISIS